jgi:hypothetical protein
MFPNAESPPGWGEPSYVQGVLLRSTVAPACQQEHDKHGGVANRQSGEVEHEAQKQRSRACIRTLFAVKTSDWHRQAHGVTRGRHLEPRQGTPSVSPRLR